VGKGAPRPRDTVLLVLGDSAWNKVVLVFGGVRRCGVAGRAAADVMDDGAIEGICIAVGDGMLKCCAADVASGRNARFMGGAASGRCPLRYGVWMDRC
jgi:hypothetical protein